MSEARAISFQERAGCAGGEGNLDTRGEGGSIEHTE